MARTAMRVRLPMMDMDGQTERLSRSGTLEDGTGLTEPGTPAPGDCGSVTDDICTASPQEIVRRLEEVQAAQASRQGPSPEVDALLARVLAGRPELRPRLAVMCRSALLRNKILAVLPPGGRAVGSGVLGTTHPWRKERLPDSFTDHNWPKVSAGPGGLGRLPGGTCSHDSLLRAPADKIRQHPTLAASGCFSVPKARRFPSTKEQNERQFEIRARQPPGPGHYMRSVPRGTAFSNDGGETVILGANHACPWKGCLGRQINPVDVDFTTGTHAPCFSFSRTRRAVTDPAVGQAMNSVKTDFGNLSPGPVYELFGSMSPSSRRSMVPRRTKSVPSISRVRPVRMIPCPPDPADAPAAA